jgi:asparagine synthase (glutamine-hydrolysing)
MLGDIKARLGNVFRKGKAHSAGLSAKERELVSRVRGSKLTYLSERKLASLLTTCRSIEERNLPGIFLEAGCALGGSAILLASVKRRERPLNVYDVFGMIPPPTESDTPDVHARYQTIVQGQSPGIQGDRYYGYVDDLYDVVIGNLERFGIECKSNSISLVRGLVQDTLVLDAPVALAHIDVDWYDPVKSCLERVFPRLVVGGSMILDDYHSWGGCRKATDEYLKKIAGRFRSDDSARSMRIDKIDG